MTCFRQRASVGLLVVGLLSLQGSAALAQGPAPVAPPVSDPVEEPPAFPPPPVDPEPETPAAPEAEADTQAAPAGDHADLLERSPHRTDAAPGAYHELHGVPARDALQSGAETGDFVDPDRVGATDDDVGHFPGSIAIPSTAGRVRFGAIAHLSMAITWMALAVDDRFSVAAVPVDGSVAMERGPRFHMSARESRIYLDFRTPTAVGLVRAYLETDFTTAGNAPTLRHAYGQVGNLMVGHTWSAFMDVDARPELIDIEGPDGAIRLLHPSVRYTIPASDSVEIALSAESPEGQIGVVEPADGDPPPSEPAELYPDMVGRLRIHGRIGHLQLAGIARRLGMERVDDPTIHIKKWAWGGSLSTVIALPSLSPWTRIRGQAALGRGIARYIVGTNSAAVLGEPLDGIYDAERNLMASLDVLGWYVALTHGWTSTLRSTGTAGGAFLNTFEEHEDSTLRRTHYFSLNLIWSPAPSVDLGVEQILGLRENRAGAYGSSTQTQLAAKVRF